MTKQDPKVKGRRQDVGWVHVTLKEEVEIGKKIQVIRWVHPKEMVQGKEPDVDRELVSGAEKETKVEAWAGSLAWEKEMRNSSAVR